MRIHRLTSVPGFIVFDLDDARVNAGGTRLAPDVTEDEAGQLARAMTYKFAVLERRVGGAKAAIVGSTAEREDLMRRFCEEVRPLTEAGEFLTGADLGTSFHDFDAMRPPGEPPHVMGSSIGGTPLEDLVTGYGVVAAAEAAIGSLEGLTFAIEGFGKVGSGVAREAVRRGARVVCVSTLEGAVWNPAGLDVELMIQLRRHHGDGFVWHLGSEVDGSPLTLFDREAEVVVPGARPGVVDAEVAERMPMRWVVPAANVPYTRESIDVLRARRVRFLPDFVCNAGATIGFVADARTPGEVFREVGSTIARLISEASIDPTGYYAGACGIAERFLATWRGADGMPEGPPLA